MVQGGKEEKREGKAGYGGMRRGREAREKEWRGPVYIFRFSLESLMHH